MKWKKFAVVTCNTAIWPNVEMTARRQHPVEETQQSQWVE